jgi:DNA-binding transcriptional LysR family regulator
MSLDLKQMRQFTAVAETLHFGEAARRLNMAQPPLSQAIQRLEADLGVQLFDRSKRAVKLTAAGRVFLAEANRTLLQAEYARKMTQRAAAEVQDVRVSFIGPALYRTLPGIIAAHRTASPAVEVRLLERPTPQQVEGVLNGDLDVGFISPLTDRVGGLAALVVERDDYVAVVPSGWDLAQRPTVRLIDLADRPFITPSRKYDTYFAEPGTMFSSLGIAPRIAQEADNASTILSLVSAGLGCSIMSSSVAHARPASVRFLKIVDAPPHRPWELMMIWSAERTPPLTQAFVQTAKDYVTANPKLLDLSDSTAA